MAKEKRDVRELPQEEERISLAEAGEILKQAGRSGSRGSVEQLVANGRLAIATERWTAKRDHVYTTRAWVDEYLAKARPARTRAPVAAPAPAGPAESLDDRGFDPQDMTTYLFHPLTGDPRWPPNAREWMDVARRLARENLELRERLRKLDDG